MTKQDTAQLFKLDPLQFTKAPLRAEQTVSLNAPPEKVWALISDHEKLPTYLSMVEKVTVDNSIASTANGVGAVRSCSIGAMTLEEEIQIWKPNRALAYALREGNPMGMSGHLAARGKSPAAFDQRCIPPGYVVHRSNTARILPLLALPRGRIAGLGATQDFHHGLLGVVLLAPDETGGTTVRWQQYFNHPDADMMATQVADAIQLGISGLLEIFGGAKAG